MGYYMDQMETDFKFKDNKEKEILNAIKSVVNNGEVNAWVNKDAVNKCLTFECALSECRWDYNVLDNYKKSNLIFNGTKLGDEEVLFNAIAPYVEDESYIQMLGEDGLMWRWLFKNGKCNETYPEIIWNF